MPRVRRTKPVPRPKRTKIVDETLDIATGHERHLQFQLKQGDTFTVICKARTKFYCGFFARPEYVSKVNAAGPGMFGFEFGTDSTGFSVKFPVPDDDEYFLVLRNGVFSPRAAISIQVSVERVGSVEPTIRSG